MGEVASRLKRMGHEALNRSPRENLGRLRRKLSRGVPAGFVEELNAVVPDIRGEPSLATLAASRLPASCHVIRLLGSASETSPYRAALEEAGVRPLETRWDWEDSVDSDDEPDAVLVCKVPMSAQHWEALRRLRDDVSVRVIGIQELLLPFAPLQTAMSMLPYYRETSTLSAIAPYYLGREFFRPIDSLNAVFPLAGKSVIEFGPMDGCLTAGLVAAGVDRVVSIEARAENFIKTLIAREVFGWSDVQLVMDDFHNANRVTYGRFDLVFAHGVYYHSIAPFLLFKSMLSLSDHVYIGGFCATDSLPVGSYEALKYGDREYLAKEHRESAEPVTGGVNATGYYFRGEDLMGFFRDEGCDVQLLSDEPSCATAGRYVRFLARRPS